MDGAHQISNHAVGYITGESNKEWHESIEENSNSCSGEWKAQHASWMA